MPHVSLEADVTTHKVISEGVDKFCYNSVKLLFSDLLAEGYL